MIKINKKRIQKTELIMFMSYYELKNPGQGFNYLDPGIFVRSGFGFLKENRFQFYERIMKCN